MTHDDFKQQMSCKTYFMNVGYPDLRQALRRRGWLETDNINEPVDLKFTYALADIGFSDNTKVPDTTLINHCKAEGCMTCKTQLIDTLNEGQKFWASWLADASGEAKISIKDYEVNGIDSFFPKSFAISKVDEQLKFFEEKAFIQAETYLKLFKNDFEKDKRPFCVKQTKWIKEKIVLCADLIQRKVDQNIVDDVLNKKGGSKKFKGIKLKNHEF